MALLIYMQILFCLLLSLSTTYGFIPHPLLAYGVLTSNSITHTEITQLGVIRSLARFFYDTRLYSNITNGSTVNKEVYFATEHTIDDLYHTVYPEYDSLEKELYSHPLKCVLDSIMTHDVLVDFDEKTKKVAAAHFDSEAFMNGSRRILKFRQIIVNDTRDINKDLTHARNILGQLLHTLQDFYSHSNWIEMNKTDINELIGMNETIGLVAGKNQSTCTSNGCTRIVKNCTLWQQISLGVCPLVYYDCQNNILSEINNQELLTSGYYKDDVNENNELIGKPGNVEKCSHGSVLDSSAHIPAIGGINKDSYSLILSPHSNLQQAADLAVKATERFLNDLRQDIGDNNFDRLLVINPTGIQRQQASDSISQGKRFRFFTPHLSARLEDDCNILTKLRNFFRKLWKLIKSALTKNFFDDDNINKPTYDLSDKGVNIKDVNNFRAAPYLIGKEEFKRKKRNIYLSRKHRYL